MKGEKGVLDFLQRALRGEMAAHNQYILHGTMLENMGYVGLAGHELTEAKEERKHLLRFLDRMVFLEGKPDMQTTDPLRIGTDIPSMIANDLAAELDAVALYMAAAQHCEAVGDFVTREIFVKTLTDEQSHVNFLETQQALIVDLGLQIYAQRFTDELEGD